MYVPNAGFTTLDDFENRCSRGIRQTLIDVNTNRLPTVVCEQIGEGGDACFVTFVSYDRDYPSYIATIVQELERVGFNGSSSSIRRFSEPYGRRDPVCSGSVL